MSFEGVAGGMLVFGGLDSRAVGFDFAVFLEGEWLLKCYYGSVRGDDLREGTDISASMASSASSSRGRFWRVAFLALRLRPGFSDDDELSSLYFGAFVAVWRVDRRVPAILNVLWLFLLFACGRREAQAAMT